VAAGLEMGHVEPMDLSSRRWLVVLGKGGVGRTTVSLALAGHGRRVALVEVNGTSSLASERRIRSPARSRGASI